LEGPNTGSISNAHELYAQIQFAHSVNSTNNKFNYINPYAITAPYFVCNNSH